MRNLRAIKEISFLIKTTMKTTIDEKREVELSKVTKFNTTTRNILQSREYHILLTNKFLEVRRVKYAGAMKERVQSVRTANNGR